MSIDYELCDVCSAEGYPYNAETCKNCEYNPNSAEVETYMDDIGGIHSPCDCYNPYGYYCGDCGKLSCKDCKYRDLQPESESTK